MPLRLQVVWAVEALGEIDEPTISWMLVTTLPVADFVQACQYLQWYSYRWLIERYHYVLKSGCRVESLQLERFDRLARVIDCLLCDRGVAVVVADRCGARVDRSGCDCVLGE